MKASFNAAATSPTRSQIRSSTSKKSLSENFGDGDAQKGGQPAVATAMAVPTLDIASLGAQVVEDVDTQDNAQNQVDVVPLLDTTAVDDQAEHFEKKVVVELSALLENLTAANDGRPVFLPDDVLRELLAATADQRPEVLLTNAQKIHTDLQYSASNISNEDVRRYACILFSPPAELRKDGNITNEDVRRYAHFLFSPPSLAENRSTTLLSPR